MLDSLKRYLGRLNEPDGDTVEADDRRLAVAALLVHAVAIDGVVEAAEKSRIRAVLKTEFGLDAAGTCELIALARARDREAVDLYTFTSVLKRALDAEGRRHVIELLWEVVYADGELHEFEDNLVWRVAELLAVPREERLRLKRRVARRGGEKD